MAKFVIQCPVCGVYNEAKTGFFAKKALTCTCGHVINVKTEKMTTRTCVHCGNTVVFDQSKGETATCPICKEKINTFENQTTLVEFSCPSCSCNLTAGKAEKTKVCPLCDTVINVEERVKKEEIKKKGVISVIKYEGGNDVFVWKHPIEDFNLGSQLIVHESQEAIFFKDGKALDLFGAGRYTLATQNLPILENLYKLPANPDTVFHSEVYFVNLTTQMGIKWGTDSKVQVKDPESQLFVELGASGNFNLRVSDSRKLLLKVVGTTNSFSQRDIVGTTSVSVSQHGDTMEFSIASMVGKFKALIMNKVKAYLANVISANNIFISGIDSQLSILSEKMREILNEGLEEYGLFMPEFFITNIMKPEDPNYRKWMEQHARANLGVREEEIKRAEAEAAKLRKIAEKESEIKLKMMEAEAAAQMKVLSAQGDAEAIKLKGMADADVYLAKARAEAEEMHAKGYTYQQETARQVGMEAMQNGITGNGSGAGSGAGSVLSDMANLGMTLGAMGSVVNMTKEALNPMMQSASEMGSSVVGAAMAGGWDCACGTKNIATNFCPNCGTKKPVAEAGWDCACGTKNIKTNFCPNCGTKKPVADAGWDCACGMKDIKTNFCPNCGAKKA